MPNYLEERGHVISYSDVKRGMDFAAAAVLLVAASPLMAVTAVAVKKNLGSPVLFKQDRPGLDGKIFTLLKFRSMKDVDEAAGLVTNEQRMTPFGSKLRSTSLDELPSLLNVLKGDMSFVGPRPLMPAYLERYTPEEARRHEVRPGITGMAQVSGRNLLDWSSRFKLDVEYVDNLTFSTDLKVLAKTLRTVLSKEGVSGEGEATMSAFMGSKVEGTVNE